MAYMECLGWVPGPRPVVEVHVVRSRRDRRIGESSRRTRSRRGSARSTKCKEQRRRESELPPPWCVKRAAQDSDFTGRICPARPTRKTPCKTVSRFISYISESTSNYRKKNKQILNIFSPIRANEPQNNILKKTPTTSGICTGLPSSSSQLSVLT